MNTHEFDWNHCYTGTSADYEAPDALLVEIVDTLSPGRALDVGCGAGGLLAALADRGWEVSGVDISRRAIAAARAVLHERGHTAELHVGDSTAWTPPGQYDLITQTFALPGDEPGRAALFAMIRAAVAPGGVVLLKDFDATMAPRHEFFAQYDMPTVDELASAFEGFQILRADVVDTPPHDHDGKGTHAGEHWTAALLMARKPMPTAPHRGS